ncbi:MAG: VWA domain-containing protein [Dehalococcoidia bacterium]|nr:VWA domain-containing protein [Dehalococcoidia bacterium]
MRPPKLPLPRLMSRILAAIVAMALLALVAVACGGDEGGEHATAVATPAATPAATTSAPEPVATEAPDAGATTTPTRPPEPTATPEPAAAPAATEAAAEEAPPARGGDPAHEPSGVAEEAAADMDSAVGGDAMDADMGDEMSDDGYDAEMEEPVSVERSSESREYIEPTLSAGEVDDNERWEEYLQYRDQYQGPEVHDVDVSERYVITVSDTAGHPVPNAEVRISAGEAVLFEGRTYANGQTLFFPRAFAASEGAESFTLSVAKGEASQELALTRGEAEAWDVVLDLEQAAVEGVPLDVLFLLDSTGSMADEIGQIKATLLSIATRISDLPSQPDLRMGMVAYRDRGDEFVTRLFDFEAEPARFLETIHGVVADGGDDYPESLNEAFHVAVHEPQWRRGDAIRLMFLIADAPPHLDYQDDYSYADVMVEANRRGIKTFSIASSGLDAQGEYVFRQIAQHTMGRFLFIVYGPGGTTSHSVSDYTVERLDDLVVSLVEEELAYLER